MRETSIAIIPARGGSKRIPCKNILEFAGKPMIAHSIEAAQETGLFSRVVVSTDNKEIAEVAVRFGAEVPFLRPAELADDYTGTSAVVAHALEWLQGNGEACDYVCCIYATAPFMRSDDLVSGFEKIAMKNWQFVFSAGKASFPVHRSFRQGVDGKLAMLFPEHALTRSQDLSEVFYDAGQFYWGRTAAWLERKALFERWSTVVVLPRGRVHDIDTPEDLDRARQAYEILTQQQP